MTTPAATTTPHPTPHPTAGTRERVQYLVIGLVIGALWIAHRNEPLWEHAARTLLVLVAVPLLAAPVLAWWRKRQGSADTRRVSLVRFVAAPWRRAGCRPYSGAVNRTSHDRQT